jgi:predicted nucleic acid-binding protein
VIYLDSSVALAQLFSEDRKPDDSFWEEPIVSSRLLEYEIWNRINARNLRNSHAAAVEALLDRIALIELTPVVLARALEPFSVALRTLDSLHLASIEYLRNQGQSVALATFDERLGNAARALGITVMEV